MGKIHANDLDEKEEPQQETTGGSISHSLTPRYKLPRDLAVLNYALQHGLHSILRRGSENVSKNARTPSDASHRTISPSLTYRTYSTVRTPPPPRLIGGSLV
jgi:hypothetical protein